MVLFWETLTDMSNVVQALQELSKKYRDTVLGITFKDKQKTIYGTLEDVNTTYCYFNTKDGQIKISVTDENVDIFIPKVATGCYTAIKHKSLYVLSYLPHRQWKKGLCKQNTEVIHVPSLYTSYYAIHNDFNPTIQDILENTGLQQDRTIDKAFKFLDENNDFSGVSLNRNFGITLNFTDEDVNKYYIFNDRYLIGYILRNEQKIIVENDIFLQEVIDTQNVWCPNYKVNIV